MKEITFQDIQKVNESIKTLPLRGKDYREVFQRVKAFRMLYPGGQILTEIVSLENGMVVIRRTACDEEGFTLRTGYRYEKEGSTTVNKTSFIENCETSAVGRALAFRGIGIDVSIASAEEVINAVIQNEKDPAVPEKPKAKKTENKKPTREKVREKDVDPRWENRICEYCGEPIDPVAAKISFEGSGHFFCSGAHAQEWLKEYRSKVNAGGMK